MEFLTRDLRLAARGLFRSRGFLLLVVGTIGLGVGANTTIFSVLNALVLRPLPFEQSERLVYLDEQSPQRGSSDWMSTSYLDFLDWRAGSRAFEQIAAFQDVAFDLSGTGSAERASGAVVTDNLFATLRARPLLGRALSPGEDQGGPPVVVVGHGLWKRLFGADPAAVGRTLLVDGTPHLVVGVMPEGFRFPEYADLWVPLRGDPARMRRDHRVMAAVGRLAPGVGLDRARSEIAAVNWRLAETYPASNDGVVAVVKPLKEALRGGETTVAALLFQGITLLVLVIAWVNVANLLLVRAVGRSREMSIRAALGATRGRVVRQLLAEGLVLAVLGGALGLVLGYWGRNLLVAAIPVELPFWMTFGFDWRVVAFAASVSGVGVLVFTLVPVLQTRRVDLQGALKAGGGRGGTGDARGGRLQGVLVVAETSLAVVLLISAGLMARSLYRLQAVDPGFEAAGVAVARLTLPPSRYDDPAEQQALWARLLERASGAPGVEAAAAASALPLTGGSGGSEVEIEGRPASTSAEKPFALASTVSPDYFRVMRIPLRGGRAFGPADRADARHVVVVSRAMAERFWPGESPIGRRVRFATDPAGSWRDVVGVAGDVKDTRLSEPAWPTVYVPYTQSLLPAGRLVVRTAGGGNPAELVPLLRAEVRAIDPQVPFDQTGTLEELVRRSTWTSRLYAWLAGVFAGAALLLAAVGMYGMLDYMVRQRTQEIGVRAALGAETWSIVRLFVWRGLRLMLFAMLLGLPAGFAVSRLLSSLLYGIEASDLLVFACVPLLMLGVGLLASYLPAHTAARVDPSTALRQE